MIFETVLEMFIQLISAKYWAQHIFLQHIKLFVHVHGCLVIQNSYVEKSGWCQLKVGHDTILPVTLCLKFDSTRLWLTLDLLLELMEEAWFTLEQVSIISSVESILPE